MKDKKDDPLSIENLVDAGMGGVDMMAKIFVGLVAAVIALAGYAIYTIVF